MLVEYGLETQERFGTLLQRGCDKTVSELRLLRELKSCLASKATMVLESKHRPESFYPHEPQTHVVSTAPESENSKCWPKHSGHEDSERLPDD